MLPSRALEEKALGGFLCLATFALVGESFNHALAPWRAVYFSSELLSTFCCTSRVLYRLVRLVQRFTLLPVIPNLLLHVAILIMRFETHYEDSNL
jgi:hypothetical protein